MILATVVGEGGFARHYAALHDRLPMRVLIIGGGQVGRALAERLPNGNTLITDTLNNRVIEINPQGEIVWQYKGVRLPYSADRLSVPEEGGQTIPGWRLQGRTNNVGRVVGTVRQLEGYARWVLPIWMRLPEIVTLLGGLLAGSGLIVEGALAWWRS